MGENLFSFFFFFFSSVTWVVVLVVVIGGGATFGTCCTDEVDEENDGVFPEVKFNQELTRPCLDSSQFLANSFSAFFFSSAANSASRLRAASSEAFCSNCLRLRSKSAKSFMVKMCTDCLNFTGSSSSICNYKLEFRIFKIYITSELCLSRF